MNYPRERHVQVYLLAEQYAYEALKQLLDLCQASAVDVTSVAPHDGWLRLRIRVSDMAGAVVDAKFGNQQIGSDCPL